MICPPCLDQVHRACPELRRQQDATLSDTDRAGGQWCDCQHKPSDRDEDPFLALVALIAGPCGVSHGPHSYR